MEELEELEELKLYDKREVTINEEIFISLDF